MKIIAVILMSIFVTGFVFAGADADVLEFKSKIGFTRDEDKIVEYRFFEGEKKLLIIGEKYLQVWDIESARLINQVPHQIPQFAPRGFAGTYLLLGLPKILDWRPFLIDEAGRWIITAEKTAAASALRSAVVRDLRNLKQIARLDLPNVSTEYVSFDEGGNEIRTFGITDKTAAFARWNKDTFAVKETVVVKEYKWHHPIRGGAKMIVGSGDTKFLWSSLNAKQGDRLTLRDVETGAVEKEFAARNLKPESAFQETTVSADEKFLISKRDDRIFVWEIDGAGDAPKFEISAPNPKSDFSFKGIYDGKFIVVKIDGRLRVYETNGGGEPRLEISQRYPKEDLNFVRLVAGRFAVIKAGAAIRICDLQGGKTPTLAISSDNPKDSVQYVGSTADGKRTIVRDDRKISVFETAGGGKPLYEIARENEKERFPTVALIENKDLLVVARVNRSEKKDSKTEFYNLPTGKLVFDAGFEAVRGLKFTPDGKYLYQTQLGGFSVWNIAARTLFVVGLETHTPSYDANQPFYVQDSSPTNTERADFSPDYRYILRHGGDVTAIFETATGKELQTLFDAERVKYDKKNRIKKSGLGDAGWLANGKYVYAPEPGGFFGNTRTISFWRVKE